MEPLVYVIRCYHCGSTNAERMRRGPEKQCGRWCFCRACKKKFLQGGRYELQKYHIVLQDRIDALNLHKAVAAEVYQMAALDVLNGFGYCFNVALKVKEATREIWGEYKQQGSEHPVFKREQGQKYERY